ncbi:MAG: hypothetical protein LBQ51_10595 [Desulfovibrio sp.]|jgi:hypothetical protein|nr:hypothetical protein [Desulfovibrio sp.]
MLIDYKKNIALYRATLVVLFFAIALILGYVTDTLGIFVERYDEFGDIVNGFTIVNFIPAGAICYILDGYIAVKFEIEKEKYRQNKQKRCVINFLLLYCITIILYLFLSEFDINNKLSFLIATMPLWIYGAIVLFKHNK